MDNPRLRMAPRRHSLGRMAMTASAPGFGALAYVRLLKEVRVDEGQAEAVRDAITEGVATKADIARIEDKMATTIDLARIETRITGSKVTMLPAMVALAGVIAALAKLLP